MKLNPNETIKPLRDIVAVIWLPPKTKSGIIIPETYSDSDLRPGRFYYARVYKVGPEVSDLKEGDYCLVHEYSRKGHTGPWKENEIYFIPEKDIIGKVDKLPEETLDARVVTDSLLEHLDSQGTITTNHEIAPESAGKYVKGQRAYKNS